MLVEYFIQINNLEKQKICFHKLVFQLKRIGNSLVAIAYSEIVDYERSIYFLNEINDFDLKENHKDILSKFIDKSLFKIAFEYLNMLSTQKDYDQALLIFIE